MTAWSRNGIRYFRRLLVVHLMLLGILAATGVAPALAQGGNVRAGSLNPFPKGDIYRLHLIGDWLVEGVGPELTEALRAIPQVQVQSSTITIRSLRRASWDSHIAEIESTAASNPIDIAVVMFGVSEIGSISDDGRQRVRFGSDEWAKLYASRVDRIMKALKVSKGALYWLGLPVVRRRNYSDGFQRINAIFKERAYINAVNFIDVFASFADEGGGFTPYGPDLDGKITLLRSKDGTYFTSAGYGKIAHFVERLVRQDFNRVKSERSVTLAGGEREQLALRRRVRPQEAEKEAAAQAGTVKGGGGDKPKAFSSRDLRFARYRDQKADDGKAMIETIVNGQRQRIAIKLPRPALSAAVMSLVTRQQSPDKPAQLGDSAVQVAEGGVPLLSTVTPANPAYAALQRRNLSPTQSVFFKVWGKGERLEPQPGRADDIQWPPPEPEPVVRVRQTEPEAAPLPAAVAFRDPDLPPLPVQRPAR